MIHLKTFTPIMYFLQNPRQMDNLESWNTWEDEHREPTVNDRIEAYRSSLKGKTSSAAVEESKGDLDFFSDMTPNVSRS